MSKKLPEMFANKVDKKAGNNVQVFDSSKEERTVQNIEIKETSKNINQKIKEIFNSANYIYKADVEIEVDGKKVIKRIVGKNSTHLITFENELIPITSVTDIRRI